MNNREEMPKGMTPSLPLWSYQLQRNSKLAVRSRKDLETQLIARTFKDEAFKQELQANPSAVVEKELGTKLPEGTDIKVLEETETTLYMVLPSNPYGEMTEPELKALMGLTYEDVARWVLEQQRNALLDETSSIAVMTRAWQDRAFKHELIRSPKTVIEKEWGTAIPADIEIRVVEETAHILYLVLPRLGDDLGYIQNLPDHVWQDVYVMQVGSPGEPVPEVDCTEGFSCPGDPFYGT